MLLLLSVLPGCGRSATEEDLRRPAPREDAARAALVFRNVRAPTAYVGDAACVSCHEAEHAGYQAHGMARSFYPLTPEHRGEPVDEVRVVDAATGLAYTVISEADGLYQEETLPAPNGRPAHRLRRRMDFVVGSGNAARTYVAEQNGRLYELPLTWYSQHQRWDFSPSYEIQNLRFDRLIPDRCMACHNSYPDAVPHVDGKYTRLPEGIGCERCHGPGDLHVAERLADPEPPGDIDDTIVNPAHLPFERRLDVCQQCHLHTTVSVLRKGHTAFDFKPSDALSDHLALFSAPGTQTGQAIDVVSHADRMRQSACFLGTLDAAQPLECVTCHNPHEGFRDKGPAYFNDACTTCHAPGALRARVPAAEQENHAPAANCIRCHMPRVEAENAPHASFTDHWIRVVGGPEAAPRAAPEAEILEPFFARDRGNREGQMYLGMALIVHGRQGNDPMLMATGAATLERGLAADTAYGEAYFLLGVAYQQLGAVDRAIPPLERAVRLSADVPQRLHALAQAYEAARRDTAVIARLYRRALHLQPALAEVRVDYGRFLQAQGRSEAALRAYDDALAEHPWDAAAWFQQGTVLVELQRLDDARQAFAEARRLDPAYDRILDTLIRVRTDGANGAVVAEAFAPLAPDEGRITGDGVRLVPVREASGAARVEVAGLPPGATVRVFSADGVPLRTLEPQTASSGLRWDLRDGAGALLPSGLYLLHVRARDAGGGTTATQVVRIGLIRERR